MIFIKTFFIIIFVALGFSNVYAQSEVPPPPVYVSPEQVDPQTLKPEYMVENTSLFSYIDAGVPEFENKIYNGGEVVNVKMIVTNKMPTSYYSTFVNGGLTITSGDGAIRHFGYTPRIASFDLPTAEPRTIEFALTLPKSVIFSKGDMAQIDIEIFSKEGDKILFSNSPIQLGNFISAIELKNAYINIEDRTYALQEGPSISSNTPATLSLDIYSSDDSKSVSPQIFVYKRELSGELLDTITLADLNIPKGTSTINFLIPNKMEPGIYTGILKLVDKSGVERLSSVAFRWIIDGAIVTLPKVSINQKQFKKGETAQINIIYTGSPQNIDTGEQTKVGTGTIEVTLFDINGNVYNTSQKEVNFDVFNQSTDISITAMSDVVLSKIVVRALKGENELAKNETVLNDLSENKMNLNTIMIYIGIMLASIVSMGLIIYAVYLGFKKKKVTIAMLLIMSLYGLGASYVDAGTVGAWYEGSISNRQFAAWASLSSANFTPGQNMSSFIATQAFAQVCTNGGGQTNVYYSIYNQSGVLVSNQFAAQNYGATTFHDGRDTNSFRAFGWFSPSGANVQKATILAPLAPGSYTIKQTIRHYANYRLPGAGAGDETGGGGIWLGPIVLNIPFNVSCPSGQTWNGSACVLPCTNGATNPPQCNNNQCSNSAVNYPQCNICAVNQELVNGQCVNVCGAGLSRNSEGVCVANSNTPDTPTNPNITSTYDNQGIIELFNTQPNSRLINRGGTCSIDWKLRQNAFETLTNGQCVISPGNSVLNLETIQGIFSAPSLQNTTQYTITCSAKDNLGATITESKNASCTINPGVQEI